MVKQEIYGVGKKDTIKPKRGQKAKTVMVKITCDMTPDFGPRTFSAGMIWEAIMNWKQGGIKREHYTSHKLGGLVLTTVERVKQVLREKEGKIQDVDIIFKMPSGKDHKMTTTYKAAMRSTT